MNNIVNLSFPIQGNELPADHNHLLLASLCRNFPQLHRLENFSFNTIVGLGDRQGKIQLTGKSRLVLRLPVEAIATVYELAGQTLEIGGHSITLLNPQLQPLKPVTTLKARLVTIKGYTEPGPFMAAAYRQLETLGISANLGIPANQESQPKRLTLKIHKPNRTYTIIGFSVLVFDLNPDDSIKLQIEGLGGKRRLGCGVFFPTAPVSLEIGDTPDAETIAG